jgi:plastocyanin
VGTVRIDNPGGVDVTGWRVRVTVPGGNEVSSADGAVVKQNGKRVVFTPTAATRIVPAGDSVTFSFTVYGVLAGEPTGCAIDGRPCY